MQLANSRNRLNQVLAAVRAYAKRRPWLLLFVVLLGVFTVIGSNSVAAASGEQRIPVATPSTASTAGIALTLPQVYVHVVGEVKRPGLYVVSNDARLVDAIALAGGFTPKAEQSSVNLARALTDGEQIFVLSRAAAGSTAGSGAGSIGSAGAQAKISLNRASQSELESLPRVGPALAARIMDWRTANGGFKTIEDLLKVSGFGDKMFAAVKGQVTL